MEIIGALKIKDGLFVGDEFAAQDLEFVVANKTNHIINCAARQIPNHWEPIGVKYLNFYWGEQDSQTLFDARDEKLRQIYAFLEEALAQGESVLIHSVRGRCRCICVVAAYMMKKFSWRLQKVMEFLHRRRPDIDVRPSFLQQLLKLEAKLLKTGMNLTDDWDNSEENNPEALVLKNTFVNSRLNTIAEDSSERNLKTHKLNWADDGTGIVERLVDIQHEQSKNRVENGMALLKSCLKGSNNHQIQVPIQKFKNSRPKNNHLNNSLRKDKTEYREEFKKIADSLTANFASKKSSNDTARKKKGASFSSRNEYSKSSSKNKHDKRGTRNNWQS